MTASVVAPQVPAQFIAQLGGPVDRQNKSHDYPAFLNFPGQKRQFDPSDYSDDVLRTLDRRAGDKHVSDRLRLSQFRIFHPNPPIKQPPPVTA